MGYRFSFRISSAQASLAIPLRWDCHDYESTGSAGRCERTLSSIQQFTRAPNQVARTKWLGEKRLDVESGGFLSNRYLVARRQHNDGNRTATFLSTDMAKSFYPVHSR